MTPGDAGDSFDSPDGRTYSGPVTAPGPQPAPVSPDLECTVCQHVSSPHGVPVSGATPGQAFRDTLRERWVARGRCVDMRDYDALPQEDRDDLEAAAWAAVEVALPGVNAALDVAAQMRDGRHPDDCRCQFCLEDIRDELARDEELDDDTDNAIPDTERGSEDEADYAPASPAFIAGPAHDPQWSGW